MTRMEPVVTPGHNQLLTVGIIFKRRIRLIRELVKAWICYNLISHPMGFTKNALPRIVTRLFHHPGNPVMSLENRDTILIRQLIDSIDLIDKADGLYEIQTFFQRKN